MALKILKRIIETIKPLSASSIHGGTMPSRQIHEEVTKVVLVAWRWRYVERIRDFVLKYISEPDEEGKQDGYIGRVCTERGRRTVCKNIAGLVPHHTLHPANHLAYSYYFWNAICYYVGGNLEYAGRCLARALHYAQDRTMAYKGTTSVHEAVEQGIEKLWQEEGAKIVEEAKPKLFKIAENVGRGKYEFKLQIASTPKHALINMIEYTFYTLILFEHLIDVLKRDGGKMASRYKRYRIERIVAPILTIAFPPIGIPLLILTFYDWYRIKKHEGLLWVLGLLRRDAFLKRKNYVLQPYIDPCR